MRPAAIGDHLGLRAGVCWERVLPVAKNCPAPMSVVTVLLLSRIACITSSYSLDLEPAIRLAARQGPFWIEFQKPWRGQPAEPRLNRLKMCCP